jgi:hypothetical protein
MAKLLCINAITFREGLNNIGDILGVFEDNHPFTPRELVAFDIIEVKGMTREEVQAKLPIVETKEGFTDKATGDFIEGIEKPADKEITDLNRTTLWNDNGEWKVMAKKPKYQHTLASVDPKVITDFVSKDNKVVETAIASICKTATLEVVNKETKIDLVSGKATSLKG